jgi:glucose/arabinose dehydrogenase
MTAIRRTLPAAASILASSLVAVAVTAAASGEPKTVPFAMGVPVAPIGLADQPLAPGPFTYHTAEQQDIRVTVFTRGLEYPYSLAFLPDGEMLVTERAGRLRSIRNGKLDPNPIPGGPPSRWSGKSGAIGAVHGYMNLAVHPRFSENHWIYFSYSKAPEGDKRAAAVARAVYKDGKLSDVRDVLASEELRGALSITMTPDAMLWVGTAGDNAQSTNTIAGKILRLRDDGSVPKDNPFVGKDGYRPEIYSLGHRSSMGLAMNPDTHEVWLAEMGPNGGDEINIIKPGRNYGWPLVSLGRTYPGPWQAKTNEPTHAGFEPPIIYWMPSISVSSLAFYTGDKLPKWKGDLFVGGVRTGEVPGTGHLDRILFNPKMEELRRESLLVDLHQRIRDVKQGPDGLLYVVTDEIQGAILRIEPAQ